MDEKICDVVRDDVLGPSESDGHSCDILPNEMWDMILRMVVEQDAYMSIVCVFVCRLWRDLVRDPRNKETIHFIENASAIGNLNLIKWARSRGCPWDWFTCANAARGGHLKIIKWARKNGCPWNVSACSYAAMMGHLNILRWLRLHNCPWDESTCTSAAAEGHTDVMRWAIDNGCRYDQMYCVNAAAERGQLRTLKWMREFNSTLLDREYYHSIHETAKRKGHHEIVNWVKAIGYNFK